MWSVVPLMSLCRRGQLAKLGLAILHCIVVADAWWLSGCYPSIIRIGGSPLIIVVRVVVVSSPGGHLRDAAGITIVMAAHCLSSKLGEGM